MVSDKSIKRSVLFKRVLLFSVVLGVAITIWIYRSFFNTELLDANNFDGVLPLEDGTTNIIIVHGIGHHCLGYADDMILNLVGELTGGSVNYQSMEAIFENQKSTTLNELESSQGYLQFDGACKRLVDGKFKSMDNSVDLEALVSAQSTWCRKINENANKHKTGNRNVDSSCHYLYVRKDKAFKDRVETEKEQKEREYVTGFVRRFGVAATPDRDIQIYEVTWSPATRWIKSSLFNIEQYNEPMSDHWLNRNLKFSVVNSNIADAVAYLGDSGILVNYDILQAFCLTMSNSQSVESANGFACDQRHLDGDFENFADRNRVFLVTHSLGTRVVFDSLGLLARGASAGEDRNGEGVRGIGEQSDLLTEVVTKFRRINAEVPESYLAEVPGELSFKSLMAEHIPQFAKAIRSIFVFTNQVPLLAANITSPLAPLDSDAGRGFNDFLKLRLSSSDARNPLQMVAFHDPDDLLSYNLKCWYVHNVLKYQNETKRKINAKAKQLFDENPRQFEDGVGQAKAKVRETLFSGCSDSDIAEWQDKELFRSITETGDVSIVDAKVRLKGNRLSWVFADPTGVHSNYFTDAKVHSWLAGGFHNAK